MLKNSLKISSQGYPVFLKLVDFIVINVVLIFSAHLLGLVPLTPLRF
jgi:putative colanic acid biosynthesis UDP-glucose lipid carrier transferase